MYRIFILSPARTDGKRIQMLLGPRSSFDLAIRVHNSGAPLGEVFSFTSGLYFRGKLAYAKRFARSPRGLPGVFIVTTNRGLVSAETLVTVEDLVSFSQVPIDPADQRYLQPLRASAIRLAKRLPGNSEVVLLGSISTNRYAELLMKVFEAGLKFPSEFVGRGDMSRGGLLLRSVEAGQELDYIPVLGATRHGKRPPKLPPKNRKKERESDAGGS